MRLDKFLCDMNIGTRSEVKNEIKKGKVSVNGEIAKKPDIQIKEKEDIICYLGKEISYAKNRYFMLNKPAGVVSATTDAKDKTVLDLLCDEGIKDLFPVGRLDKDTEGLLIITNDGDLAHRLLSPKKHVPKTYYCQLKFPIDEKALRELEEGVDIGEKKKTLPAKADKLSDTEINLTICEGKFHQVKRMLMAVNNEVIYLKRIQMGNLNLDNNLMLGEYRSLNEEEIEGLMNYAKE